MCSSASSQATRFLHVPGVSQRVRAGRQRRTRVRGTQRAREAVVVSAPCKRHGAQAASAQSRRFFRATCARGSVAISGGQGFEHGGALRSPSDWARPAEMHASEGKPRASFPVFSPGHSAVRLPDQALWAAKAVCSVAKASMMRSSCSGVWAALRLQRSNAPPSGAAGGRIRLT